MTAIFLRDADLRRGQAHALGGVHRFEHVLEELVQFRRIEFGHVVGFALQHRVAEFHNRINHSVQKLLHLFQIAFEIAARFAERIAAEFFQKRLRQHDRDHGLADHAGGRDHADVGALVGGQRRLARLQVHRFERPAQRRDGLEQAAHQDVLAVGDAAFEAAGAIGAAREAAALRGRSESCPAPWSRSWPRLRRRSRSRRPSRPAWRRWPAPGGRRGANPR